MSSVTFRVDDRIAIVTGSGTGMGRAFCIALAEAGADVVVTELPGKEEAAASTVAEVDKTGQRAMAVTLDVTQRDSIQAMVDRVVAEWGRIDILVNNAGVNVRQFAADVTEDAWDLIVDTNQRGVFFCSQAVGRRMIERGEGGKIVNIASQIGLVGDEQRIVYCGTKAAVINMTRVLALEWAQHKINVNAIAPTYVRTPLVEALLEDKDFRQSVIARIPLGRIAEPEDIAGAVVFLASPASDLVTGHTLVVDGGWTAG